MNKQAETRRLRKQLLDLYKSKLDFMERKVSIQAINIKITTITAQLTRLELQLRKNYQYHRVDNTIDKILPVKTTLDIGSFQGYCRGCGREVFEGGPPHPNDKEGLFHNYHCRVEWRNREQEKATG